MSKVNVTLKEFFTSPGNVPVTVKSVLIASQNVVSGTNGVLPGEDTKRTSAAGVAQFDLMTGRYLITAKSSKVGTAGLVYQVTIDVPDDNLAYEHTQLIVDGAEPFSQPVPTSPNASDVNYGLVRLSSKGYGLPETFDTIAEAKACASARLKIARRVTVLGGLAALDGGGGEYFFMAGNTDADDGVATLRPTDYAGAGADQGTLKKFI